MPNTTRELIRDNAIDRIEALTPTFLSGQGFRVVRGEYDFETWADSNPLAAFRRFQVRFTGGIQAPVASDVSSEYHEDDRLEVTVAYPRTWGLYGEFNIRDLEDLVMSDARLIDGQSGVGINASSLYVSGQDSSVLIDSEMSVLDNVLVLAMTYRVDYREAVSA